MQTGLGPFLLEQVRPQLTDFTHPQCCGPLATPCSSLRSVIICSFRTRDSAPLLRPSGSRHIPPPTVALLMPGARLDPASLRGCPVWAEYCSQTWPGTSSAHPSRLRPQVTALSVSSPPGHSFYTHSFQLSSAPSWVSPRLAF